MRANLSGFTFPSFSTRRLRKVTAIAAVAISVCGCSAVKEMQQKVDWPLVGKICENREVGKIYIDESAVEPLNVKAGDAFNHRLKCIYCGPPNAQPVQVKVVNKIVFNGRVIKEKLELQNIKQGINKFTSETRIASAAKPGIYVLDTTIYFGDKPVTHKDRFNVTEK